MTQFRILRADAGSAGAIAWAKSQCSRLFAGGVHDFSRTWTFGDFTVTARSTSALGEPVVKITAALASDGAILYGWDPRNNGSAVGPCRLAMVADATTLPASQRVTAVGLSALAGGLSFATKTFSSPSFVAAPLLTLSRITTLLERMVRVNSLFAQQMLGWLIARTTITRHGQVLRTVLGDCILSRWTGSDFYLLLGSFPRAGEAPQTVAGAPLADQPFNGVIVAWSVLKAALQTGGSPTVFQANLDAIAIGSLVNDVVSYTRKDVYNASVVPDPATGGTITTRCAHVPTTSPYASVYQVSAGNSVPPGSGSFSSLRFDLHTITAAGLISVTDLTQGLARDVSTATFSGSGVSIVATATPVTCDLSFFTGDALVKVGSHTSSGASSYLGALTFTETLQIPPRDGWVYASDVVSILLYVPEWNAVLSTQPGGALGVSKLGITTFTASRTTNMASLAAVDPSPFSGLSAPYLATTRSGSGAIETETALGVGPYVDLVGSATVTLYPQASGAPGLIPLDTTFDPAIVAGHTLQVGGIYWPRDAGLGVFLFRLPADTAVRTARALDVTKYQNIYNAVPGYRRLVVNGTVTLEAGYEDPEVVLARIAAATTVIANNFASPALYPWLLEGLVGVILDP